MEWIDIPTAVAIATITSVLIALVQTITIRNQHKLVEAETYTRQRTEWEKLYTDWQRCVLVTLGPDRAKYQGISEDEADEFSAALEIYREIDAKWLTASGVSINGEVDSYQDQDSMEKFEAESIRAEELIRQYERSCRTVITYLAQISSLVLRRKVSIDSVYNAIGNDLIAIGTDIRGLISYSWGSDSGCVAPENEEKMYRADLEIDEFSKRMGWGRSLQRSLATAERVLLLQSVLIAHAYNIGDIDTVPEFHPEYGNIHLVSELSLPAKLALIWKSARTRGRWKAIRFASMASRASRRSRRHHPIEFDYKLWMLASKLLRIRDQIEIEESQMHRRERLARLFVMTYDIYRIPADVFRSSRNAKNLSDVRALDAPIEIRDRHQGGSSADDVNSYWRSWFDQAANFQSEN